jgi:hypothetical protein
MKTTKASTKKQLRRRRGDMAKLTTAMSHCHTHSGPLIPREALDSNRFQSRRTGPTWRHTGWSGSRLTSTTVCTVTKFIRHSGSYLCKAVYKNTRSRMLASYSEPRLLVARTYWSAGVATTKMGRCHGVELADTGSWINWRFSNRLFFD